MIATVLGDGPAAVHVDDLAGDVGRVTAEVADGLGDDCTLEDLKVQHYCMAMKIASNRKVATRDRLASLIHAGDIYGVKAPRATAPTQPVVEKPKPYNNNVREIALKELSIEELRVMKKLRDRIREIENGATQPLAIC